MLFILNAVRDELWTVLSEIRLKNAITSAALEKRAARGSVRAEAN
jgi:hypothetical protein